MSKIFDSLDIVVFVVVLLGAGWALGTGAGLGLDAKDEAIQGAADAETKISHAVSTATYKGSEGYLTLRRLLEMPEEIEQHWSPVVEQRRYATGVFYHAASLEDVRQERDLELRFLAPVKLQAESEIGRVTVTWDNADRNTVDISEFEVYRRTGDTESVVGKVAGTETVFVDRSVSAGQLYSYRIRGVTADELLVKTDRRFSPFSKAIDIRGARDYQFRLLSHDAAAATGRMMVRRYANGQWHEKEFDVKAGAGIGAEDAGSGIDYGTPCTLVRFDVAVSMVPEERDEVTFDGSGKVILGPGRKPITRRVAYERRVEVVKAFCRNELGEEEVVELKR